MHSVEGVKLDILGGLLRMTAAAGLVAYLPSVIASAVSGLWILVVVDTVAYGWILFSAFRPSVNHRLKLYSLIAAGLCLGAVVLAGADGAGYVWLVFAVIVSALLGERLALFATVAATTLVMAAYATASAYGLLPRGQNPLSILVIASNLIIIFASLAFVIRRLFAGLEASLHEREDFSMRLEVELEDSRAARLALASELENSEALLRELHHRVKNNMQLALSLVALESDAASHDCARGFQGLERKLQAIAAVNEILLTDSARETVDLLVLSRLVTGSGLHAAPLAVGGAGCWAVEGQEARLSPEDAIIAAIAISEVTSALGGAGGGLMRLLDSENGLRLHFMSSIRDESGGAVAAEDAVANILGDATLRGILPAGSILAAPPDPGLGPGIYYMTGKGRRAAAIRS